MSHGARVSSVSEDRILGPTADRRCKVVVRVAIENASSPFGTDGELQPEVCGAVGCVGI